MSKLNGLTYKKKVQKFQNGANEILSVDDEIVDENGYVKPKGGGRNFPIMHGYEYTVPGTGAAAGLLNSGQAALPGGAAQIGTGSTGLVPYAQQAGRTAMTGGVGLSPLAGGLMGGSLLGAAASQVGPHYRQSLATTADPQYNTTSQVGDYTQNQYPGQQVGTGMNTGTQPEYNTDFRYPYLTHEQQMHPISRVHGNQAVSLSGNPGEAEDLSSKIDGVVGAPGRAIVNAGLGRYNAVRDYMEAPGAPGEAAAAMTEYTGPGGTEAALTQQGANQRQGTSQWHTGNSVKKEDWTDTDDLAFDVLGVDKGDKSSVANLQAFLVDSGINVGGFGETGNGVDGAVGNMTRGGLRDFMTEANTPAGIQKLIKKSPYLANMYNASLSRVGGSASTPSEAFMQSVESAIKNGDGTTSTNVQFGTQDRKGNNISVNQGKTGEKNDKTPVKGLNEVVVSQQGKNTSDKDAYEKSSNQGTKTYKDKDGKEHKTGKQGSKYGGKNTSKKKVAEGNTAATQGDAFKQARKAGKTEFTHNGKKYNTKQKGESDEAWKSSMRKNVGKTVTVAGAKPKVIENLSTDNSPIIRSSTVKAKKKDRGKPGTVVSRMRDKFKSNRAERRSNRKKDVVKKTETTKGGSQEKKKTWRDYSKNRQIGEKKMQMEEQAAQLKEAGRTEGTFVNGKLKTDSKTTSKDKSTSAYDAIEIEKKAKADGVDTSKAWSYKYTDKNGNKVTYSASGSPEEDRIKEAQMKKMLEESDETFKNFMSGGSKKKKKKK